MLIGLLGISAVRLVEREKKEENNGTTLAIAGSRGVYLPMTGLYGLLSLP